MFKEIAKRINESPWKGMVSEVGFGTPFAYNYLGLEGASETILYTNSPYSKAFQGNAERSVSKEGVEILANKLHTMCPLKEQSNPMFYLAISGSHKNYKDRGDSHGWMTLKTVIPNEDRDDVKTTTIHFRVKKSIKGRELDRFEAGSYVSATAAWLLKAMVLGDYESWGHALQSFPFKTAVSINIVDDPRISLEEHLSIADFTNPLVYHNGRFQRVIDYTRKYEKYIGGSFNPPHATHLEAGKDAMFVINFENARKDDISISDMAHRVRMLDLAGVPVMIMKQRPLTSLQAHLIQRLGRKTMTIVIGVDTFNAVCNTKYIPADDELFEPLDEAQEKDAREQILTDFLQPLYETAGVTFEVLERDGHEIVDNQWSKRMKIEMKESHDTSTSSTLARDGDHSDLTEEVSAYIKKHNLYQESE